MEQSLLDRFGITVEELEKSKDILPTLDLGQLSDGDMVELTIDSDEPSEVEHDDKFNKKAGKVKTLTLPVTVHQYIRVEDNLIVPANDEKMTLWLSSKSLRLNLLKAMTDSDKLKGTRIRIRKGTAVYKNYGENTCYTVTRVE